MGAVRNETGDFPVCDAKPSKFIGETTFAHLLQGFQRLQHSKKRESRTRGLGRLDRGTRPGSVIPQRCSMATRRQHERTNTKKRVGLRAWRPDTHIAYSPPRA